MQTTHSIFHPNINAVIDRDWGKSFEFVSPISFFRRTS